MKNFVRTRPPRERLKKRNKLCPNVFFRMVAQGRGGPLRPLPIKSFG
ncbi:MAG TPA: hypothetical protein VFP16_08455 [Vicinamibacterales bacterium]|nr:hypothetical protein [Vicinamibacterales bacterium]